ncbi:serine hydrolase domain-containing protein [Subtercola boreus]|uniref:serine hydrolase domain-containing protein n=1 Tax=Subtercola boreus TaxID=120213 RepID=UPI00209C4ECB|nr:serine hydrolase domain-containing protein [Subtercola boreus]
MAASVGTGPVARVASGDATLGSIPLAVDDTFHIGSMTKLFTAALIMQLDQEGVLSLDDTLSRWYPEAPNASAITVRMLLQHESGLAELDFDLVGTATTQAVIDNVFAEPPVSAPGTAYAYLNAGYIILGSIAEKAANIPYGEQVETRFIDQLGLTGTYLDGFGKGPAAVDGFDLGCAAGTGGDCLGKPSTATPTSPTPSPQWTGAFSAGGMVSSARDQAVWIRDLVPGVGTCLGHAGEIPGSNGIAAYCPDADLAIVILNDLLPAGLTPGYPGLLELAPPALKALAG